MAPCAVAFPEWFMQGVPEGKLLHLPMTGQAHLSLWLSKLILFVRCMGTVTDGAKSGRQGTVNVIARKL